MARLIKIAPGVLALTLVGAGPVRSQDPADAPEPSETLQATGPEVDTTRPPGPVTDLTMPPEIESGPGDVRLEPPPETREDNLEAVVTGGQSAWRLPDLGSSFRRREEERDPNQRIAVDFLPLYDPENEDPTANLFPSIEDLRKVGFLEIIRVNFGRRSRD